MYFVAGLGGRARFGEEAWSVVLVVDCGLEGVGSERLAGICGGSSGSGGGSLAASSAEVMFLCGGDGEGGSGGEYCVAASTLCLAG